MLKDNGANKPLQHIHTQLALLLIVGVCLLPFSGRVTFLLQNPLCPLRPSRLEVEKKKSPNWLSSLRSSSPADSGRPQRHGGRVSLVRRDSAGPRSLQAHQQLCQKHPGGGGLRCLHGETLARPLMNQSVIFHWHIISQTWPSCQ